MFEHQLHPIGILGLIEQRCHAIGMRGDVCVTDDFGTLVSVELHDVVIVIKE
jgi:hypothetical protein